MAKSRGHAAAWAAALVLAGCSHTMGEVPLSDGNILVIEGYGTKSSVQLSCLDKDAIEQLISTKIPDGVTAQSCYQVAVATSDSSDISKAVASFVSADNEFGNMLSSGKTLDPSNRAIEAQRKRAPEEKIAFAIVASAALDSDADFTSKLQGSVAMIVKGDKAVTILQQAQQTAKTDDIKNRLQKAIDVLKTK